MSKAMIENSHISPQIAEILSKFGIRWKATAYWCFNKISRKYTLENKLKPFNKNLNFLPAYNIAELGHLIPYDQYNSMKVIKLPNSFYKVQLEEGRWLTFPSEVMARGHYLVHLLETKKVTVLEVNRPTEAVQVPIFNPNEAVKL